MSEFSHILRIVASDEDLSKRNHLANGEKLIPNEKTSLLRPNVGRMRKQERQYYDHQNRLLQFYADDKRHLDENDDKNSVGSSNFGSKSREMDEILAKITFGLNVVLLIAKIVAAALSNSLAIISTVIDSSVDLTAGLVIWLTARAIENHNPYDYPRGRNKLEPLAVIIVSIIMGVANIVMIIQSIELMLEDKVDPRVDTATVAILLSGTVLKCFLWYFCYRQDTPNCKLLAVDQRNDVITNVAALSCALIGHYYWKYMDPLGAILVCTFISTDWFYMASQQIPILSGKVAQAEFIHRIIKICITHDPRIQCLNRVLVYHYGTNFHVELHIGLNPEMTLREACEISTPLQTKLEQLPYVEKAFVLCD